MSRFKVIDCEEAREIDTEEWWVSDSDYAEDSFLLDTKTNKIVFGDGGEPEDMTLGRNLSVFVDLLNLVAVE